MNTKELVTPVRLDFDPAQRAFDAIVKSMEEKIIANVFAKLNLEIRDVKDELKELQEYHVDHDERLSELESGHI